jgi:hypothetical protein
MTDSKIKSHWMKVRNMSDEETTTGAPIAGTQDRVIRVFISSTFSDMHAERDYLVTVVFPWLRERVEQLGLEFFDVDLRWGVPEKTVDGETANSWEYCKKLIIHPKSRRSRGKWN